MGIGAEDEGDIIADRADRHQGAVKQHLFLADVPVAAFQGDGFAIGQGASAADREAVSQPGGQWWNCWANCSTMAYSRKVRETSRPFQLAR